MRHNIFAQSIVFRYYKTMESENRLQVRDYLAQLMQSGRYAFTSGEAVRALGVSRDAAKLALNRLRHKGEVASPVRGFYVIVPPEYRTLGCLPAEQFIPSLMANAEATYYVGLLSAAQYHGAAHHRPQEFQIMLGKPRKPISCGRVRVSFHVRKNIADVPTQTINTPRGTISISTPEATAFDLIGYEAQIGGLNAAATILAELAEHLHPQKLAVLAMDVPIPWAQRLGYLLENISEAPRALALKEYVKQHARNVTALQPSLPIDNCSRNRDWKLLINTNIGAET